VRRPCRRCRTAEGTLSKPDYETHFLAGVRHFNGREFWEAHEAWETIWLVAESDVEQFLQGLIQLAAAYHHVKRGTFRGAVRLFDAALQRLSAFPPVWSGLDRTGAEEAARRHREWVAARIAGGKGAAERLSESEFPALILLGREASPLPPHEQW